MDAKLMSGSIPDLWKDRDSYAIEHATLLWAHAFGGVPMHLTWQEENRYARDLKVAEDDLRSSVEVLREEVWADEETSNPYEPWGGAKTDDQNARQKERAPTVRVRKIQETVRGKDLEDLAAKRGKPGTFVSMAGRPTPAMESSTISGREEPKCLEILAAVLKTVYGADIVEDLKRSKSARFGEVMNDVNQHYTVSENTLRKYLKRLPD